MRKIYMTSKFISYTCLRRQGMVKTMKASGMILMLFLFSQITFAQTTLIWKGTVSTDALLPANWDPQLTIAGNILQIDSAYKYTNAPVIGGSDSITINNLRLARTGLLTINLTDSLDVIYISTETPDLFGTININRGTLLVRRCEIDDSNSVVNVTTGGILETNKYLFFGGSSTPTFGGFLNISGRGLVRHTSTNAPGRFPSDTTQGIITIIDNGKMEIKGNWVTTAQGRVAKGQIVTAPLREIVIEYIAETNWTHIYSRSTMVLLVEPAETQKIAAKAEGELLNIVQNDAWASIVSFEWKYSTTSGSGYVSFSPAQTNDSIVPVFADQGNYYLICVGNTGIDELVSNEVKFVVSSDKVSVSPPATQKIRLSQTGYMLTVAETETATSREWKYSTTSGEGYISFSPAQTGTEYTPDFADSAETYFVICQSLIGAVNHNSNEVEVEVLASDAAAFDIKWLGDNSSDVKDMRNWFPIAYITNNNLIVDTPYVHAPVSSSAGNDYIASLDVRVGASFTVNKAETDTLFRSGDFYLWGELIVESGVLRISGRFRLEDDSVKVSVTGGKILMTVDFIVANPNFTLGADYINLSGDGVIDAGAQIWRWATDSLKSVITVTDEAKLIVHADFRGEIETRMARNQIMTTEGKKLVVTYPVIVGEDTMTVVSATDILYFGITPDGDQIVGVNEQAAELSTFNDADRTAFEWKYTTTSGTGYVPFAPLQTADSCAPSFAATGNYFVVCEGYSTVDTVVSNEVKIIVVSVSIAPADTQNIETAESGTAITVTESIAATSREWKYSTTSGSGYIAVTGGQTGVTYTPVFLNAGTYYVVCVSNFGGKSITSNEVVVIVIETAIEDMVSIPITIYPNPARSNFFISAGDYSNYSIQVIDLQGRLILAREFNDVTGPQLITVNQKGTFFVKVITGDSVGVAKIVLE